MGADDGHVTFLWVWIAQWSILLDGEMQDIFLLAPRCVGILPNVLTGDDVFRDPER
jgi:hypothetical protein